MPSKLEYLCYTIGIIVGAVYVFQEYRGKLSSNKLSQNPRITNLRYVIGVSAVAYLIDWKGLAKAAGQSLEIDRFEVWLHYAWAAALTILVLVLITALWVAVEAALRNRRVPELARVSAMSAVGLYLRRGYFAVEERVAEAQAPLVAGLEIVPLISNYSHAISVARSAEAGFLQPGANREFFVSRILALIVSVVIEQIPELGRDDLKANYMLAVSIDKATSAQHTLLLISNTRNESLDYLLVLEQQEPPSLNYYALPVQSNPGNCLPGAPIAFTSKEATATVIKNASFPDSTPKKISKEFKNKFQSLRVKSILSVPIQKDKEIIGVVNVEANSEIFDKRDPRVEYVGKSLHPLCMSLASALP